MVAKFSKRDKIWLNEMVVGRSQIEQSQLTDVTVDLLNQVHYHRKVPSPTCLVKWRLIVLIPSICTTQRVQWTEVRRE